MDKYAARVRDPEENQAFLEENPQLLHEHCMGTFRACFAQLPRQSAPA